MSDEIPRLEGELRDAQSKIKVAEAALADVKRQRIKCSVWSAAGGFLLFAVGGHWFPGYQLDSTALAQSDRNAATAVSEVMAELCTERFMQSPGLATRLAEFNGAKTNWNKLNYVRDGAWAKTPDGRRPDNAAAEKCAVLIAERLPGEPEKAS